MSFRKKFFVAILTFAILFQAGLAWGARVIISGTGSTDAIDTLTFSGGFLARPAGAPAASEMLIFSTFDGDSPSTVRNRIVAVGDSLSSFTVTPVIGSPNEFEVQNNPPGGALVITLNGQEVNSDVEGSAFSKAGQYFKLTATQIPTLSEWGLILFATLLLASLVWFIRRKRKPARAKA
ncbi:MAG TPA: IPTL-CTERM sorting domain-containing protein [Verrucomicrobiae bacterium]|nr:IPTL-CTERM sorting domain-containing protein [Verrucomicrobiae bacterium]